MAHDKVFGICENKCLVPVAPKTETDAVEERVTALEAGNFEVVSVNNGKFANIYLNKCYVDYVVTTTSSDTATKYQTINSVNFTGKVVNAGSTYTHNITTINIQKPTTTRIGFGIYTGDPIADGVNVPLTVTMDSYSNGFQNTLLVNGNSVATSTNGTQLYAVVNMKFDTDYVITVQVKNTTNMNRQTGVTFPAISIYYDEVN